RSATFNLGVLQGLAELGLLPCLDYLSSVSGGGYIHQFLAAWIVRDPEGFRGVERKLIPRPEPGCPIRAPEPIKWLRRYASYLTPRRGILSTDTWTLIAIWFRNTMLNQIPIVSFLAGVFLLLNLLVPETAKVVFQFGPMTLGMWCFLLAAGMLLGALVVISIIILGRDLKHQTQFANLRSNQEAERQKAVSQAAGQSTQAAPAAAATAANAVPTAAQLDQQETQLYESLLTNQQVQIYIIAPWLAMSVWAAYWHEIPWSAPRWAEYLCWAVPIVVLSAITLSVAFAGGALKSFDALHTSKKGRNWAAAGIALSAVAASVAACVMGWGFQKGIIQLSGHISAKFCHPGWFHFDLPLDPWRLRIVILPALLLCVPYVAIELTLGLLGRDYVDTRREWLARLRAWSMLYALMWTGLTGIALVAPYLVYFLLSKGPAIRISAVVAFLGSHITTLLAGSSGKSDGKPTSSGIFGYKPMDLVAIAAAPVAVVTFLIALAFGVEALAAGLFQPHHPLACTLWLVACVIAAGLLALLFGWRLDINEFSMQSFYRNRLSRCYLAASLWRRKPNPFSGFDMRHRVETANPRGCVAPPLVADLIPDNFDQCGLPPGEYGGPFPIFCSTLNLTTGEDLASQERKGASFAFTPLYSGYNVDWTEARKDEGVSLNGYVPTRTYAYRGGGIHIDTAVAISGAAVNPNQGYNSNPALAFLMTFFNVRLGWWITNPRKIKLWQAENNRPTPLFALGYLLKELFGSASDKSGYVNLSDGGHFENMGLYELVRRRCKYIIVCDAEEDPEMKFNGIGNAVNRCRADFGAEIDLDLRPLQLQKDSYSQAHCVVGTIRYPPPHRRAATGAPIGNVCECLGEYDTEPYKGVILYMKSSLVGDEPADLLAYKLQHGTFPQDSTANQWFAETQFESYRRLGHHIAMTAIRPALSPPLPPAPAAPGAPPAPPLFDKVSGRAEIRELFKYLFSIWYPPTPEMQQYLTQHVQQYQGILAELRERSELADLADRLFDTNQPLVPVVQWDAPRLPAGSEAYARQFFNSLLDFMYTVYVDLELAFPDNRTSPHADWWVCLFRRWCRVSLLRDTWTQLHSVYSNEFKLFAKRELKLP
ncbi:MAG: hypothetical protein WBE38_08955, partial [Terracidiphilus sp.]